MRGESSDTAVSPIDKGYDASVTALQPIRTAVIEANECGQSISLVGGNSKSFYGGETRGTVLDLKAYTGVVAYEPSELVFVARCGTPLLEVEAMLAERSQMLGFEPPRFSPESTIGGVISAGLSGPARPYCGAVRDHVIGTKVMSAEGELLSFGGRVMKNVAGYDISRLMAGSLGTLGPIMEIAIRVLPSSTTFRSLSCELTEALAIETMTTLARQSLSISAMAYESNQLRLRLSGSEAAVDHALKILRSALPSALVTDGADYWSALRDFSLPFFDRQRPLWRLSVPPATPPISISGEWLIDWGGAQRWLHSEESAERIRAAAQAVGGFVNVYWGESRGFHPLPAEMLALHQRIKAVFDPKGIFNRGRLYADL